MTELRALSVRQPFASLIEVGMKPIELRSWATNYRGQVLILSGSRPWSGKTEWPKAGPLGVTLCVVDLVDCRPAQPTDATKACVEPPPEWFAWVLENPRPVARVAVKGRLGLYFPDATLLAAVAVR